MYCCHCGQPLYYKDPSNHGWCVRCDRIVAVSPCKVSFWNLMAVFVSLWAVQPIF
jgi:hypothetical protein